MARLPGIVLPGVPHHVTQRGNGRRQTIRLAGLHFETADSDELNYRSELRDAMLRALGNSRFAVYHHVIRRRADVALDGDYRDSFSQPKALSASSPAMS